jgi:hypothetical protein
MGFILDFAEIAAGDSSHSGTNEAPCTLIDSCKSFRETCLHINSIA